MRVLYTKYGESGRAVYASHLEVFVVGMVCGVCGGVWVVVMWGVGVMVVVCVDVWWYMVMVMVYGGMFGGGM